MTPSKGTHYLNGFRDGKRLANYIEPSRYKNIDEAIYYMGEQIRKFADMQDLSKFEFYSGKLDGLREIKAKQLV